MTAGMSEQAALTQAQKTRIWIEANLLGRLSPAVTLLAYLFLFVPIVVLVAYSFNASRSTVVWSGFTFDWYGEVFKDRGLRQALQVSAIIAFVSALVSTAIGALTALAIVRRRFPPAATRSRPCCWRRWCCRKSSWRWRCWSSWSP